ncbi:hypothetical protein VPNG_10279 [Cytospora leucostoma]|uniref:alpha-L-fucosidase n=1 Tax=Cytospora leucostoma TaxID=1230097 RepID=A0A423VCT4_9PEZI|nr:hypothetical protein VPNG_10279 [Cytospora leucostoma]
MKETITNRLLHAITSFLWLNTLVLAAKSVPIELTPYFNHKAFGTYPNETTFDTTYNRSFPPLNDLAPEGLYTSRLTGIQYNFPSYTGPSLPDNLIAEDQRISIPRNGTTGKPFSLNMLVANDLRDAIVMYNLTYLYTDGTTALAELRALSFFNYLTITHGEIISPFTWTPAGKDWNTSQIFEFTGSLDPTKTLAAVQLPVANNATVGRLHVFSISLWSAAATGAAVEVQSVRPTQKWTEAGNQVVEITLNNVGVECLSGTGLRVSLKGLGVATAEAASLRRLCPGDQRRVNVGVTGAANGTTVAVTLAGASSNRTFSFPGVDIGFETFTSDLSSIAKHESPDWFDDAKYGIMIHWGPYAVPGYGGVAPNETYAEWFWWYSNNHFDGSDKSDCYDYRLETFGPDWNYDDGFANFTAASWDPKEWVDLFADAGAKYFVLTTKHHDGFALFDTGLTSNRSAIHYGPKRDIVQELFDAAATYQPSLKRGTYFSLPEWYNPDFGPYGFSQYDTAGSTNWLGIPATNPFTNLTEPYTGKLPADDFIRDLQYPQMETLAYRYGTDMIWCDCGTANNTAEFAAGWWNWARGQGRQVAMNSRCGVAQAADFETPEYSTYSSAQRHKWESNRGVDPYSYGYNARTPAGGYMNASTIVYTLVDMVAKNGNLLLDIGPRPDGSVVEAEAASLRAAGRWIRAHAEAVFGTAYWFVRTQVAGPPEVRFTQTGDAFYVLFLEEPEVTGDGYVWVNATVPVLQGDIVSMVGVDVTGVDSLAWKTSEEGYLAIKVSEEALGAEEYCWVFKIAYT